MRPARQFAVAATALIAATLTLAGCSSPISAQQRPPQIVMTSPTTGFAAWPSGARWIVIGTTDGWQHVTNRTPLGVPTDGGLVVAADQSLLRVGVLPFRLLRSSPILLGSTTGTNTYASSQLGLALPDSPSALLVAGSHTYAVAKNNPGASELTSNGWRFRSAAPRTTKTTRYFTAEGVGSPDDGKTLYLVGSNSAGPVVAFSSADNGGTWNPVLLPGVPDNGATAVAPCASGTTTLLPVVKDGAVYAASRDASGRWTVTASPRTDSTPVVTCGGGSIWAFRPQGSSSVLEQFTPTGAWVQRGTVAVAPIAATAASSDTLYAATSQRDQLTRIRLTPSPVVTVIALPKWISTIGGSQMTD